ncbi:hypothetical protein DICVIV_06289 [Dictyocaulus viviparus]|uniref:Uncharacterized protein n=1 Tax=Dictyocaulus viviparus TaxID=29172 RepID=A0A0D8XSW5_DICVI|nr:hypothetical protein DICVIV_06289 [Dictyocaulus viviparus]
MLPQFSNKLQSGTQNFHVGVFRAAAEVKVHPLNLMLPVTITSSYAFVLPVGTPPNAIVFSTGMVSVAEMSYYYHNHNKDEQWDNLPHCEVASRNRITAARPSVA